MGNFAKKIDLDLQNGARIANNEEIENIQASENIINKTTKEWLGEWIDTNPNQAKIKEITVSNDNDDNPSPEPTDIALPIPVTEEDEEYVSNISIDIDNVSSRTGITKAELWTDTIS